MIIINRIDDIRKRFEAPNESNRWDNPLFRVKIIKSEPIVNETTEFTQAMETAAVSNPNSENTTTAPVKAAKSSWKPKKKPTTTTATAEVTTSSITEHETITSTPAVNPTATLTDDLHTLSISGSQISHTDDMNLFVDYELVLEQIVNHITTATTIMPNSSTVAPQHSQADLLYELDRISAKLLQQIISHQADSLEGTPLKLLEFDRALTLHRHASLAELQRYRSQFVKIHGKQPPTTSKAIGASFVDFIATQLE